LATRCDAMKRRCWGVRREMMKEVDRTLTALLAACCCLRTSAFARSRSSFPSSSSESSANAASAGLSGPFLGLPPRPFFFAAGLRPYLSVVLTLVSPRLYPDMVAGDHRQRAPERDDRES